VTPLTQQDKDRLHAYLQSIVVFAIAGQRRLEGDNDQAFIIDILSDIRGDLDQAEEIAHKDETL
jgi:hypothetical protein